jgi:hypothetical protein
MKKIIIIEIISYSLLLIFSIFFCQVWVPIVLAPLMIIDVVGSLYFYRKLKPFSGDWPQK